MTILHKQLAEGRWFQLSLVEQLANIGTDVERTIRWKKRGELQDSKMAFARALDLLDLSIIDPKNRGARLKELKMVREALIDYFEGTNQYSSTEESWYNYFYAFNYAVAIRRGK